MEKLGNQGNHDFGLEWGRGGSYGGVRTTILHGISSRIEWYQSQTPKTLCFFSVGGGVGAAGVSAHTCDPYVYYSDPSMAALSSYKPIQAPPSACLFIYHLPASWTDSDLAQCFAPFAPPGVLLKALVYKDRATGLSKGFGFVDYDNPLSAQNAINAMNGMAVDGKRLRVEIKKPKGSSPY